MSIRKRKQAELIFYSFDYFGAGFNKFSCGTIDARLVEKHGDIFDFCKSLIPDEYHRERCTIKILAFNSIR